MKLFVASFLLGLLQQEAGRVVASKAGKKPKKKHNFCWLGCEFYGWGAYPELGYNKWLAMIDEMGQNCEVIVHVGDTNAGGTTPCLHDTMVLPLNDLREVGKKYGIPIMYTIGDNENNDCFKACVGRPSKGFPPFPSDVCSVAEARPYMIDNSGANTGFDVTGNFAVEHHTKVGNIPGTSTPFSCDFDNYMEFDEYAVATVEVVGSQYYLADETDTYPTQDQFDPIEKRYEIWLNAMLCFEDWINYTAEKAHMNGKKAIFFAHQAHYWGQNVEGAVDHPFDDGIGEYYNSTNLCAMTQRDLGRCIEMPFDPVYNGYRAIANKYPEMAIYVAVADSHYIQMIRQDSTADNAVNKPMKSYQNLVLVQADSQSRGLVIYQSLDMVDEFWPVQMHQHWSKAAFDTEPKGIQYYPAKGTDPPCWQIVGGVWVKTDLNCDQPL